MSHSRPGIAALTLLAGLTAGGAVHAATTKPSAVPFIEDDYAKAVAQARERKLPLFIEAWAPW